jgi:hypothetical protein
MATKTLSILLAAKNQASTAIKTVEKDLSGLGVTGKRVNKGFSTFGHNLKSAAMSPLGLIGITGGLFGLEHVLSETITKAQDFGSEVSRMTALTGQSAEQVSAMASALEHFGVSGDDALRVVGLMEKNLGNLTKTKKSADAFEKTYGLHIRNTNGSVKTANDLLLTSADYFNNKNIPAQTKAAALAKLYGRSWQQLIPFLKAGSKGISDAEAEAKRLGLTLTGDNLAALQKNKDATREWNTALGGLELQIGLKLLPYMTDLATTATRFVEDHGSDITGFFDDAAKFAGELAGAIQDDVIPAFQMIGGVWNQIPPEMKKLLIAGFAVDKLSGGAISGIVGDLGKGLIKGVLGMNAGVVNINAAVVNGGGASGGVGALEGAAGAGIGGTILTVGISAASVAALGVAFYAAMTAGEHDTVTPGKKPDQGGQLFHPGHGFGPASGHGQRGVVLRPVGEHSGIGGVAQRPAGEHSVQQVKQSTDKVKDVAQKGLSDLGGIERTGTSTLTGALGNTAARIAAAVAAARPVITTNVNVQVTAGAVQKQTTVVNRYFSPNGSAGGAHNHPVNVNGGGA